MTKERAKEILDAACGFAKARDDFNEKFADAKIFMPNFQFGREVAEEIANALQLTRKYIPTDRNFVLINFTYNGVDFFG